MSDDLDLRYSVYKRKGRKGWTLEYRELNAVGKVKPVQRSFDTKTEAEQAWEDVKDRRRRGAGLRTSVPTFGVYSKNWLKSRTEIAPSSVSKYEWAIAHLDEFAPLPLTGITREAVRMFLAKKAETLGRSSCASIGAYFGAVLSEAVADGYLRINPAEGGGTVKRKRTTKPKPKAMEAQELRAFLAMSQSWRDFFHVSWALGLRPGETIALMPADVDFDRHRVRIERTSLADQRLRVEGYPEGTGPPKGRETGWVDLPPGAAAILKPRVAAGNRWLFPGPGKGGEHRLTGDRMMGHASMEHAFKRIAARAGLGDHFTPHCLRHTFASLHLQRGTSVYYVSRMLRHASIEITVRTYGSWLDPGRPAVNAAMEAAVLHPGIAVVPTLVDEPYSLADAEAEAAAHGMVVSDLSDAERSMAVSGGRA